MGRREWAWTVGTAFVLLLAVWVSGAGTITAFRTPEFSPPATKEYGETLDQGQTDNASARGPRAQSVDGDHIVTTIVVWTLRVLLVLIIATILFFVVRALARRLRRDPVSPKDAVEAGVLPDVLVSGLRDSEAALDRGTTTEAVINAWLALERTALALGIDDDASRTPTELVTEVLTGYDVDVASIERLADLYREARFSLHPIGEEQREAARQALRQVREDLDRPLLTLGEVRR